MSDALFALALAYRLAITVLGGWLTARLAPDRPAGHALRGHGGAAHVAGREDPGRAFAGPLSPALDNRLLPGVPGIGEHHATEQAALRNAVVTGN